MEDPPKKFHRLSPAQEVRLRYAYFITCVDVIKDKATGEIKEVHCKYDQKTKGGDAPDGRKVKGTLHWVSARHAVNIETRLYDHLFVKRDPEESEDGDFKSNLNPESLKVLKGCYAEPSLMRAEPGSRYQFERKGYFYLDGSSQSSDKKVFNRIVGLRDTWSKFEKDSNKR